VTELCDPPSEAPCEHTPDRPSQTSPGVRHQRENCDAFVTKVWS
jgi:hypothetical protein